MTNNTRGYWVSEKNVAYFSGEKILGADGPSFQKLNEIWAKDRKHVYTVGRRIAKADPASFRVLNPLYAKDANYCYYLGGIIKEADTASFRVLDDGECFTEVHNGFGDLVYAGSSPAGFAADDKQVFHYVLTIGKPCVLRQADPASFQVLGCGFGRDHRNAYWEKWRLKGADATSFNVIPPHWGKDNKGIFYGTARLPDADPPTFEVLSSLDFLARDANHYCCREEEIQRDQAYPHGSPIAGYPLSSVKDPAVAMDYLRRGATPHDRLALETACREGNIEMVRLLLNAGCDPRITDKGQNSCLTELYLGNYLEIAELLVQAGADPNHMIEYSPALHGPWINAAALRHPLEHALFQRRFDLADFLISRGADINAKTGEGLRLIDYFRKLNGTAAVEYLLSKGA